MKNLLLLAVLSAFLLASCATKPKKAQIANPFVDCKTLAEGCQLAGYQFAVPERINDYVMTDVRAITGNFLEIIYRIPGDKSDEVRLRKAYMMDDASGDYRNFQLVKGISVSGKKVLLKGEPNCFHVAIWTHGKYGYAVNAQKGLPEELMQAIAATVD